MCNTPFNCENTFESKNIELVNSKEKDDANPSDSLQMAVIIVVGRARLILYMRGEPYRKAIVSYYALTSGSMQLVSREGETAIYSILSFTL